MTYIIFSNKMFHMKHLVDSDSYIMKKSFQKRILIILLSIEYE